MPDAEGLVEAARVRGITVGCAESLTGGALAAAIVDVPGASAVLRGAIVAYAPDLKSSLLGVGVEELADHGPVSEEVARAMARGVRRVVDADVGVATTGAAGPEPHGGAPAGTAWVAASAPWAEVAREVRIHGGRAAVRGAAVAAALRAAEAIIARRTTG